MKTCLCVSFMALVVMCYLFLNAFQAGQRSVLAAPWFFVFMSSCFIIGLVMCGDFLKVLLYVSLSYLKH